MKENRINPLFRTVIASLLGILPFMGAGVATATVYSLPPGSTQLAVGDFNGDKKPDVAVISCLAGTCYAANGGAVLVMLNNGDGTFGAAKEIKLPLIFPVNLVAADFTGEGKLDLAIGGYDASNGNHIIQILKGNGKGGFTVLAPFQTSCLSFIPLLAGDFDNDKKQDLVCQSVLIPGKGTGKFGAEVSVPTGQGDVAGDFNNDKSLDLVFDLSSHPYMSTGNGDGTFQSAQAVLHAPGGVQSIAVGDVNGDLKPDLAIASYTSQTKETKIDILLGQGNGTFLRGFSENAFPGPPPGRIMIADYNNDGQQDIFLLPYVFLNIGKGKLGAPTRLALTGGPGPYGMAAVDLNADGKADVVLVEQEGTGGSQLEVVLTE